MLPFVFAIWGGGASLSCALSVHITNSRCACYNHLLCMLQYHPLLCCDQRLSGALAPTVKETKKKGVAGYFEDASSGLGVSKGYWQVVEVREDARSPGHFVLWAFTAERKLQVRVVVLTPPRVALSSCFTPAVDCYRLPPRHSKPGGRQQAARAADGSCNRCGCVWK